MNPVSSKDISWNLFIDPLPGDQIPKQPRLQMVGGRLVMCIEDLPIVAEVVEEETPLSNDPYQRFWSIVHGLGDHEDELVDFIANKIGIEFVDYTKDASELKSVISLEEIDTLVNVMEWICLLSVGYLPAGYIRKSMKQHLGVDYFIELLTLPLGSLQCSHKWSMANLFDFIDKPEPFIKSSMTEGIIPDLAEIFYDLAGTERIVVNIKCYCDLGTEEFVNQLWDLFDKMDLKTRIRWSLFVSVAGHQLSNNKEGMTARPGQWPSAIPKELVPLLEKLDQSLGKTNTNPAAKSPPRHPINSLKLRIPELPNWMPNGGNSCYFSAAVWGLLSVANQEVQEKIQILPMVIEDPFTPQLLKKAINAFVKLFSDLSADEIRKITVQDVNDGRWSIRQAFPASFAPGLDSQDDAFECLLAIVTSLLELPSCQADAAKFYKTHLFTKLDDQPICEKYDYEEALKGVSTPEPLPLVDIRFDDNGAEKIQSLKALVTLARNTDMMKREVPKIKAEMEGPKYQYIDAHHTEQLMVESKERAPEYFIGRLARFSSDHVTGIRRKLFNFVLPNASLEFSVLGSEGQCVCYDLTSIIVHRGTTLEHGHYYIYFLKVIAGEWKCYKYDDMVGCEECTSLEEVVADVLSNGYIYFYKKRGEGQLPPPPLPTELEDEQNHVDEAIHSDGQKKTLKRSREELEEKFPDTEVYTDTVFIGAVDQPLFNFTEAKEWIIAHLNAEYSLDEKGFLSIEELLQTLFQYEVNPEQAKRTNSKERESLIAASKALKRPLYLIEPSRDIELQVIDSAYIAPGDSFCHGEDFLTLPIYIYRQEDGTCFLIMQQQGRESGFETLN